MKTAALKPVFDLAAHQLESARRNFAFANQQGGAGYSYEAMAKVVRYGVRGLGWDNSSLAKFVNGELRSPRQKAAIAPLFVLSDRLAAEVRFSLRQGAAIAQESAGLPEDCPTREDLLDFMRQRFSLVNMLGGRTHYSLEKLAQRMNEAAPDMKKIDKSTLSYFLKSDAAFAQLDIRYVVALMELSVKLLEEIRPHVDHAQALLGPRPSPV